MSTPTSGLRPCLGKSARARAHNHTVSIDGTFRLNDRCRSGLLWWTVGRAVALGQTVTVDKRPVEWARDEAAAYVRATAPAKWHSSPSTGAS